MMGQYIPIAHQMYLAISTTGWNRISVKWQMNWMNWIEWMNQWMKYISSRLKPRIQNIIFVFNSIFFRKARNKRKLFFAFSFFFLKTYNFHPDSKIDISFFLFSDVEAILKDSPRKIWAAVRRCVYYVAILIHIWLAERGWEGEALTWESEKVRERASERESEREKERVGVCFSFSILLITPSNVAPFILSDDTKKFWNKKTSLRLMLVFCFLSEVIMLVLWLLVSGFYILCLMSAIRRQRL